MKAAFLSLTPEGGTILNPNESETRNLLNALGAEPLDGSGFEDEIPEADFATEEG